MWVKDCIMKNLLYLLLAPFLFCANCTNTTTKIGGSDVIEIDIIANLSKTKKVNLSSIASSIEYCKLETNEQCLIGPNAFIYCSKDYIVTVGIDQCYVFDRKTGKFLRKISSKGQGPGEYTETISTFWDGNKEQICVWGNMQYIFYNIDGTLSHKINKFNPNIREFIAFEDLYVGYVHNTSGNSSIRIAFYDKTGVLLDSIPNYRVWKKTHTWSTYGNDARVFVFHDELYYKDIYCDTLYHIKNFALYPRYIFITGDLSVPYEIQEDGQYNLLAAINGGEYDRYDKYIVIYKMLEDNKHLYFTMEYRKHLYPVIYYKTEDELQIMPPVSIPRPNRDWKIPLHGFENDLDEGLPFWPQQMISCNEMMCVYTVEELFQLDASKIIDTKLKNVLNRLDEDSNPVVVIAKLK